MTDLLIIVPSRGRPQNIQGLLEAWGHSGATCDLVVAVDDDDPTLPGYEQIGMPLRVGPRRRLGPTLNEVAWENVDRYRAIGFMGDDHRPRTIGWDDWFVEELGELGTGFVYGDDLLQGEAMPTAVAMTSNIVRALGWMSPPALTHLFIDVAWLRLGQELDRIRYLPDVVIEHMHPANGKAETDAGYQEANSLAMQSADRDAFIAWEAADLPGDVDKLQLLLEPV